MSESKQSRHKKVSSGSPPEVDANKSDRISVSATSASSLRSGGEGGTHGAHVKASHVAFSAKQETSKSKAETPGGKHKLEAEHKLKGKHHHNASGIAGTETGKEGKEKGHKPTKSGIKAKHNKHTKKGTIKKHKQSESTSTAEGESVSEFDDVESESEPEIIEVTKPKLEGQVTYSWSNISCEMTFSTSWVDRMLQCKCGSGNKIKTGDSEAQISSTQTKKVILRQVSGVVNSGEMWALMGSSGAGKTTLLNILNFNTSSKLHIDGDRLINGAPIGQDVISSVSAYVQQYDMFLPLLTVREHLIFSSLVRLSSSLYTTAERHARVDEVLKDLGLWHCRNARIGGPSSFKGISGGEKKRLSFAAEILTDPNILFCDEPTSGLDSFMARSVVEQMQKMAERGKIIICTIHQPSTDVFHMFDNLYLLTEGRVAYAGLRKDALKFFAHTGYVCPPTYNPADYYIHTLSIIPTDAAACLARTAAIAESFTQMDQYKHIQEESRKRSRKSNDILLIEKEMEGKNHKYKTSSVVQFKALLWRSGLILMREPLLSTLKIVQNISIGLFFGAIFFTTENEIKSSRAMSLTSLLIASVLLQILLCMYSVICTFSLEIPIFLREHWNGMYRCWTYYMAKTCIDLPFVSLFPIIYFPQIWLMANMNGPLSALWWHILILAFVSNVGASIGYATSTWTPSVKAALVAAPIILSPIIMFGGNLVDDNAIFHFLRTSKYFSVVYFASENAMQIQWNDPSLKLIGDHPHLPSAFQNGMAVLEHYNYSVEHFRINFIAMAIMFIILRLFAYVGLYLKTRK